MNRRTKLLLCLALIASAMTLVTCKPIDEEENYVGIWFASNVETPIAYQDVKITLNIDGTFETLMYNVGGSTLQSGSSRGTYTSANNIFSAQQTEQYNGSAWVPASDTPPPVAYSVGEDGNTLTLFQDFDQNGTTDAIWTLTRQ